MSRVSEQGEYFHLLVYSPQMAVGVRSSWVSQVGLWYLGHLLLLSMFISCGLEWKWCS